MWESNCWLLSYVIVQQLRVLAKEFQHNELLFKTQPYLRNIMLLNWVNIDRFVHLCVILNVMSVISNLLLMIIEPQQIIYSYIFKNIVSVQKMV